MILYLQTFVSLLFILFLTLQTPNVQINNNQDLLISSCCYIRNNPENEEINELQLGLSYNFFNKKYNIKYKKPTVKYFKLDSIFHKRIYLFNSINQNYSIKNFNLKNQYVFYESDFELIINDIIVNPEMFLHYSKFKKNELLEREYKICYGF